MNQSEIANNLIQKSAPIMDICQSVDFSLLSLKLLDVWLARIDPRVSSQRSVTFSLGDIEKIFGLTQMRNATFKAAIMPLLKTTATLYDPSQPDECRLVNLFESSGWKIGNRKCEITLTCTQSAKRLFFNMENLQYYRYRLSEIIEIKSKKSYLLFMYITRNYYRREWTTPIERLREVFMIGPDDYPDHWRMLQKCLRPAVEEINEKTGFKVECETEKSWRESKSVRFRVVSVPKYLESGSNQQSDSTLKSNNIDAGVGIDTAVEDPRPDFEYDSDGKVVRQNIGAAWYLDGNGACRFRIYVDERLNKLYDQGTDGEIICGLCKDVFDDAFTWEQLEEIVKILKMIPLEKMPLDSQHYQQMSDSFDLNESAFFRRFEFCLRLYEELNERNRRKPISDKYAYFIKMLKNKYEELQLRA